MPQEGDARNSNGRWEVYAQGAWYDIADIEPPEGFVGVNIDPRGPILVYKAQDGSYVTIDGEPVQSAASQGGGQQQAPQTQPAWWGERVEAIFGPWGDLGLEVDPDYPERGRQFSRKAWNEGYNSARKFAENEGIISKEAKASPLAQPQFWTDPETGERWAQTGPGGEWKPAPLPRQEKPQGASKIIKGETVGGPAGSYFIQDADGTLRSYTPAKADTPTFDDIIDKYLTEWSSGGPNAADALQNALRADNVRDFIESRQGMPFAEAAQLAVEFSKTREEAAEWLRVLTNPFGMPEMVAPNPFVDALPTPQPRQKQLPQGQQANAPQAPESQPTQPSGPSPVFDISGVPTSPPDPTGGENPPPPATSATQPPTPFPGESDEAYQQRYDQWNAFWNGPDRAARVAAAQQPTSTQAFAAAPPTTTTSLGYDENGFPTFDAPVYRAGGVQPQSVSQQKASRPRRSGQQPSPRNIGPASQALQDLLTPQSPVAVNPTMDSIQATAGDINPTGNVFQPNNKNFNPKTGAQAGNPFLDTVWEIGQRRKQKQKQAAYERGGLQTARFR